MSLLDRIAPVLDECDALVFIHPHFSVPVQQSLDAALLTKAIKYVTSQSKPVISVYFKPNSTASPSSVFCPVPKTFEDGSVLNREDELDIVQHFIGSVDGVTFGFGGLQYDACVPYWAAHWCHVVTHPDGEVERPYGANPRIAKGVIIPELTDRVHLLNPQSNYLL